MFNVTVLQVPDGTRPIGYLFAPRPLSQIQLKNIQKDWERVHADVHPMPILCIMPPGSEMRFKDGFGKEFVGVAPSELPSVYLPDPSP